MCGIAGMVLSKKIRTADELEALRKTFSTLVVATQIRGRDATGGFVVSRKKGIRYHKSNLPALEMVKTPMWWGLMDEIDNSTVAVIAHTRAATQGSPEDNSNNHPIHIGNLVGVHNGIILNDDDIREECPFDAEVDSAAIFALLDKNAAKHRLNTEDIARTANDLIGDFAIAVADSRRPNCVFIARDDGRPLVMAHDAPRGVLWLSSTAPILRRVYAGNPTSLPAWSTARLTDKHGAGAVVKVTRFGAPIAPIESSSDRNDASTADLWTWLDSQPELND